MPRFRKKPVVIEAEQFHPWAVPAGVFMRTVGGDPRNAFGALVEFFVVTAHGQETKVVDGDWIIPEPDGRGYYPCKPDIFEAIYEPVSE